VSVVGIDLGTTNTVVGCVRAGKVHVLADERGTRLLPSVVSFHPNGEVLVGAAAKGRRLIDAKNTVYSHKRLIGRSWASAEITQARRRFPFELREGPTQGPLIHARGQDYTLPEVSAFVLKRARLIAEQALGAPVDRAVITVPAHFNELQRAATKVAGRVSGLEVLRILNEPTAAALAYGLGRAGNERVAVYDLGGGTFDCTLLDLNGNVFEVLATAGDSFLGGDDVDAALAERMADAFLAQHRQDVRQDATLFERLKSAAEELKIALSSVDAHTVTLRDFSHGPGGASLTFAFTMTRRDLEAIVTPLVDRSFKVTQDALSLARLAPSSFDKVILVGGSTRIPVVRQRVEAFFGARPLDRVNPDEVVAIGAAIQAAALTENARRRSIPAPPGIARRGAAPVDAPDETKTGAIDPSMPKPAFASAPPTFGYGQPTQRLPPAPPIPELETLTAGPVSPREFGSIDEPPSLVSTSAVAPALGFGEVPDLSLVSTPGASSPGRKGGTVQIDPRSNPAAPPPPHDPREALLDRVDLPSVAPKPKPARRQHHVSSSPAGGAPMTGAAPLAVAAQPFGPMERVAAESPPRAAPPAAPTRPQGAFASSPPPARPFASSPPPARPFASSPPPFASRPPPVPPVPFGSAPPPFASRPPPLAFGSAPPPAPSTASGPPPGFALSPAGPSAPMTLPPGASPGVHYQTPILVDVTPRALVVETAGGYSDTVIPRNSKIPCERTRKFATGRDMQTSVRVRVAQGESQTFAQNTYLGEIELSGLRPAIRGELTVSVTFEVDADGTLRVRARDVQTGQEARATLQLVGIADESSVVMMINRFAQRPVVGGPS
jgi:molecular chaperone DnaK